MIVLEFLEGQSLLHMLEKEVHLTQEHRKNIFRQVTLAVQQLHMNFMLHRDLKPANIMFTGEAQLKLIDFGLTRQYGPDKPMSQNTFTL